MKEGKVNLEPNDIYENLQLDDNDRSYSRTHIRSIFSWFLLICVMWHSYDEKKYIWEIFNSNIYYAIRKDYIPLKMTMPWLQIFILFLSISSFLTYLYYTIIKKKENLLNGMLDCCSKYHYLPFLFISAIFIIEENAFTINENSFEDENYEDYVRNYTKTCEYNKKLVIAVLVFTIILENCLILIYHNMKLNCHWYFIMLIKKGFFSTLIILFWYYFFYIIICLKSYIYILDEESNIRDKDDDLYKFYKGTGIAFSIVIAIGSFAFSIYYKDIVASFANFLIYIGLLNGVCGKITSDDEEVRNDYFKGNFIRTIDIIVLVCNFILICFIFIQCKKSLFI